MRTEVKSLSLRKFTETSFKEYIFNNQWLVLKELLKFKDNGKNLDANFKYLWCLWTKQNGKDAVNKDSINPFDISKTHYHIHYGKDLDKRFEKYRKHLK